MEARQSRVATGLIGRLTGALFGRSPEGTPRGLVSFTFDDFPQSAWLAGGSILARCGARGTYYTSMKLAGTRTELGPMFAPEDVRAAHRAGHEIACHTYSHLNCAQAPAPSLLADVSDNAAALAELLPDFAARNFAYPFGAVSADAKASLGPLFSTCRGIAGGTNDGTFDVAELRANSIYARTFEAARMRALIDRNRAAAGWLIFYTHDISENPSPYGCRPEQLETVVSYAVTRSTVLPVGEAFALIGTNRGAAQATA